MNLSGRSAEKLPSHEIRPENLSLLYAKEVDLISRNEIARLKRLFVNNTSQAIEERVIEVNDSVEDFPGHVDQSLPGWIGCSAKRIQLHLFSDASKRGRRRNAQQRIAIISCAAYWNVPGGNDRVVVRWQEQEFPTATPVDSIRTQVDQSLLPRIEEGAG